MQFAVLSEVFSDNFGCHQFSRRSLFVGKQRHGSWLGSDIVMSSLNLCSCIKWKTHVSSSVYIRKALIILFILAPLEKKKSSREDGGWRETFWKSTLWGFKQALPWGSPHCTSPFAKKMCESLLPWRRHACVTRNWTVIRWLVFHWSSTSASTPAGPSAAAAAAALFKKTPFIPQITRRWDFGRKNPESLETAAWHGCEHGSADVGGHKNGAQNLYLLAL